MKALKTICVAFVLIGLTVGTGCEKSKSKDPAPENISGTWSGTLTHDESKDASAAQFIFAQTNAAVNVTIEFDDPSIFGGWAKWSTHLGSYTSTDGVLFAFAGKDQLTLTFSGNEAKGTLFSKDNGLFKGTLTKSPAP